MSAKKAASTKTAAVAVTSSTPDNHISVSAENEIPKVTTRLIFPGPVILGTITSAATSGTVNYRRLYATAGGDTTTDSTTGSAVIPILR